MNFPIAAVLTAGLAGIAIATLLGSLVARVGFPIPDEDRRLGTIDGLRGYLALLVMIHHFSIYLMLLTEGGAWRQLDATVLNNFGGGSVSLFFMITGALFIPKAWHGLAGYDWRSMYISRVFRILPLHIVTVAIISVIALIRVDFAIGNTWISFPARFALWLTTYSQPMLFGYRGTAMINAFVLWSLHVEWKFYLIILPIIALLFTILGTARGRWLIPALMLIVGIACWLSDIPTLRNFNYSIFACGMLALLLRSSRYAPLFRGMPAALLGGAALILSMALVPVPDHPLALAAYTLFFACVICGNRFGGLLASKGALVLGEASFSIYMLHGVLLNVVFISGHDWVAGIAEPLRPWLLMALIPLMSGLAIALYMLVERPGIALGRRLGRRWRRPPPTKVQVSSEAVAP